MSKFLSGLFCLLMLFVPTDSRIGESQEDVKVTVQTDNTALTIPPVSITDVLVSNQSVASKSAFTANKDWFRNLSVKVTNTSKETVKFIMVAVEFDSTEIILTKGKNYFAFVDPPGGAPDITLLPEQSIEIAVGEQEYNQYVSNLGSPDFKPNSVVVRVQTLVFEDLNSAWRHGYYMKRVSPRRWERDDKKMTSNLHPYFRDTYRAIPAKYSGGGSSPTSPARGGCWTLTASESYCCVGPGCGSICSCSYYDDFFEQAASGLNKKLVLHIQCKDTATQTINCDSLCTQAGNRPNGVCKGS